MGWIVAYMDRRKLLGPHWEFILNNREYNLFVGFEAIKEMHQRIEKLAKTLHSS